MQNRICRVLALLLALALLSGCGESGVREVGTLRIGEAEPEHRIITFDEMVYSRPDLSELEQALVRTLEAAQEQAIRVVMDGVYQFYDLYDLYYTHTALADIHYSADLTDESWAEEYRYCSENSARVDAMLDELYYGLAASPSREKLERPQFFGEGFFEPYLGENPMNGEIMALLERESTLKSRYYDLSQDALAYETASTELYDACADEMAALLVELISLRQQIAAAFGYESYPLFAWDSDYIRDYDPAQLEPYLADIRRELVPLYREIADSSVWDAMYEPLGEEATMVYLRQTAEAMGGTVEKAFHVMTQGNLCDTRYSDNKYNSSFELYLTSYGVPYLFMNPELTRYDCLTLAHEFGHYCNDYASGGTYTDVDVSEVFSQAMEYLSLLYAGDGALLTPGKMADSLALYVEQSAYLEFELRMYDLTGEDLSVEGLYALYDEIALAYGFDSMGYDRREFVETVHFYTYPMYIPSYILSNDAALQLYCMELSQPGSGVAKLEENLDTQQQSLMAFIEEAGLSSPFLPGRIGQVRQILEGAIH